MTTPLTHEPQNWEAALKQAQAINHFLGPLPIIRRENRSIYQPDSKQDMYLYTSQRRSQCEFTRKELIAHLEEFDLTEGWR